MRHDVYLINDAGSWSVVAAEAVDAMIQDYRQDDDRFVQAFQAALFGIEGDDYSVVRIVANEPLLPEEDQEWIARSRWRLTTSDGCILVCSGFDPDCLADWCEEREIDPTQAFNSTPGDYIQAIQVPPGDYHVSFYSYLHSMNGAVWLSNIYGDRPFPNLLPWWQHDHANLPLPTWAVAMLEDEDWDPSGQQSLVAAIKSGQLPIARQPLHWIGYLVHLLPWEAGMEVDQPKAGWFEPTVGRRQPDRCPLGISTDCSEDNNVERHLEWLLP